MQQKSTAVTISFLWVAVILEVLVRDVHEFLRPGVIEALYAGRINGQPITEGLLLLGGVMLQIPILMIVLTHLLRYRAARLMNMIVAPVAVLATVAAGLHDADDVLHAVMGIAFLTTIFVVSYHWRDSEDTSRTTQQLTVVEGRAG